jgi:mono/diheme cytochrome c family protein
MRVHRAKLAALAALVVGGLGVAGCDTQSNADVTRGRELFITNCGTCHQLKEAGTTDPTGPDLDAAFADSRASGMDSDTFEGVVEAQIENPRVTDPDQPDYMPANLVTGQDVEDVATYVAQVAGVPGIEPPEATGGPGGQVFANNGCGSCHTFAAANASGTIGPNLDEVLAGQSDADVEESIVDPEAKIASGFSGGVMPANYGDTVTPQDLTLLIEFLIESAGK